MADQKKALDQRTRQLASGDVENGQEQAAIQATQQQLMAIQAERNQNLAVARTESKASSEVNQVLSQAAQVGAMTMAETPQAIETPVVNPATQNTLAKYGVGQPKFQKSVSHSQQVTKQNITINNNTTSNTTNNVQVPANIGGPIQGRPLAFKPQVASDSTGKFKAWISSAFARQTEEGARRDREYRQRENSLSKSAGKMMKRLEELGRTVSTRLDPRRIGSTITSQIRTLLFVLGIGFMAQNWPKILEKVADIESGFKRFLKYIGIGVNGKSELHKKIVSLLGGNKESENAFQALRKLISNDDPQSPGLIQELSKYLHDKVEERREAMKLVKFPDLDLSDMPGTLKQVAGYLGDILTAMVSGAEGVKNSISKQVERTATAESSLYMKNTGDLTRKDWNKKITTASGDKKDTDIGTMSLFEKGENRYRGLTPRALKGNGELDTSYGAEATVSQGEEISRLLLEANQGKSINTAQISTGLRRLKTTADKEGMIPVSLEFINNQLSPEERKRFSQSKDIIPRDYHVVARKKNENDRILEESSPLAMAGESYLTNTVLNETPILGNARRNIVATKEAVKGGILGALQPGAGLPTGIAGGLAGYVKGRLDTNPTVAAAKSYVKGTWNKWNSNDYRLEVVPEIRPGDIDTGETQRVIEISPNVIQMISDKLSGKEGVKIDTANQEFLEGIEKELIQRRTTRVNQEIDRLREENKKISYSPNEYNSLAVLENNGKIDKLQKELSGIQEKGDLNISETFKGINKVQALEEKHKKERVDTYSRRERASDEISGTVSGVVEAGKEAWNESPASKYFGKMTVAAKDRAAYTVKRLMDEGLTREQAAGIAGNIQKESSFNPKAGAQDNNLQHAGGIVGWNGDNYKAAVKYFGRDLKNVSYEDQLEYLIKEMKGEAGVIKATDRSGFAKRKGFKTGDNVWDIMKQTTSVADSTNTFERIFEGSGDYAGYHDQRRGGVFVQGDRNKKRIEYASSIYASTGGDLNNLSYEEDTTPESEEEPKSLLQLFIDNMKKAIFNFGGGISKMVSDVKEQLPKPKEKIKHWNGPITSEFSDYDSYLKNPGNIEPGLSYVKWANRVFDMTGFSPLDLTSEKPQNPWQALTNDEEARKNESLINKVSDSIVLSSENENLKEKLDEAFRNKVIDAQRYIKEIGDLGEWIHEGGDLREITVTAENLSKYLNPKQYKTYQEYVDKLKEKGLEHRIIGEDEFAMDSSSYDYLEPTRENTDKLEEAIENNTEATIGQTKIEAQASGIELDPENNVFSQFLTGNLPDVNKDPKLEYLEKINLGVQDLIGNTGKIQAIQRVGVHTTAKVVDAAREGANATREVAPILASTKEKPYSPIDWNSVDVSHRWGEFGGGNYDVN